MFLLAIKYVFAITPLYLLPVILVGVLSVFAILVSVLIFMTHMSCCVVCMCNELR
jgi:hypothetical protein